jgi:hypothetical protein
MNSDEHSSYELKRKSEALDKLREVLVDRAESYGSIYNNMEDLGRLKAAAGLVKSVSPREEVLCQILNKISRLRNNINHEDSWLDIAGWAINAMALPFELVRATEPSNSSLADGLVQSGTQKQIAERPYRPRSS